MEQTLSYKHCSSEESGSPFVKIEFLSVISEFGGEFYAFLLQLITFLFSYLQLL